MATPRRATHADVPELVRLRALMFAEMGIDADGEWQSSAGEHLERELSGDRTVAVVIDAPDGSGRLAASGIIEFDRRIPTPMHPNGELGYIGSMSTDAAWRRRGYARSILEALLAEAVARDVTRVELHATDDGAAVYRAYGFVVWSGPP